MDGSSAARRQARGGIESIDSNSNSKEKDRRGGVKVLVLQYVQILLESVRHKMAPALCREMPKQEVEVCHRLFQVRSFIGKYSNRILEALM